MSNDEFGPGCGDACCCGANGECAGADELAGPAGLSRRDMLEKLAGVGLGVAAAGLVAGCNQSPAPAGGTTAAATHAPIAGSKDPSAGGAVDPFVSPLSAGDALSRTEDGLYRLADTKDLPYTTPSPYTVNKKLLYLYHGKNPDGTDCYTVFDRRCPHRGCTIKFAVVTDANGEKACEFRCPCHGSRFDSQGERISGPATRGLTRYYLTVRPTGKMEGDTILCIDPNRLEEPSEFTAKASPFKPADKGQSPKP